MIFKTPTQYFLVSGASDGYTPLNAFDGALLQAGIGNTNIVKMSSIVPPHCQRISPIALPPGALVPAAYAVLTSDVPEEIISAKGDRSKIEETVRNMAVEGMKLRGWEIKELKSVATEYKIKKIGAILAAVVLWG